MCNVIQYTHEHPRKASPCSSADKNFNHCFASVSGGVQKIRGVSNEGMEWNAPLVVSCELTRTTL